MEPTTHDKSKTQTSAVSLLMCVADLLLLVKASQKALPAFHGMPVLMRECAARGVFSLHITVDPLRLTCLLTWPAQHACVRMYA